MYKISIKEASELLGVNPVTIRRWEKIGKITSERTEGNHRRYNISDLLKNKKDNSLTIAYARVSSNDQKAIWNDRCWYYNRIALKKVGVSK